MIKVSDYVMRWLADKGITQIFMITGGGAMHLNDSVGRCSEINFTCNHHEQACAFAAEGYVRASGKPCAVVVTSGPGGTNCVTGVYGQWTDSVPVIYISGQVKFETTVAAYPNSKLRQLGDQEISIIDIVRPITKFAAMVTEPAQIKKYLEQAYSEAVTGRPGPVWLDIPLNVQGAMIDELSLVGNDKQENKTDGTFGEFEKNMQQCARWLQEAERPIIIAGHGIRTSGSQNLFQAWSEKAGIPIVTTFNGFDLVHNDNPLFIGRIGTIGDRAGNFALQNADLILSIGSRNNIRQVSYSWKKFGRSGKKIIVDIDATELTKPTVQADLPIHADVKDFLEKLILDTSEIPERLDWLAWCQERKRNFSVVEENLRIQKGVGINPYYFMQVLTTRLSGSDVVVAGDGTACVALFQAGVVKGQRMFWNSGCAAMGYELSAAIGACFGNNRKEVICLAGDGSFQLNLQELQTVVYNKLPIKIFYLNNNGYSSIRQTQNNLFNGNLVGCDAKNGVSFPDIKKIANAYSLDYYNLANQNSLDEEVAEVLKKDGPFICEVNLLTDYKFIPKLVAEKLPDGTLISKPLEDMSPFLDRDEFNNNMIALK